MMCVFLAYSDALVKQGAAENSANIPGSLNRVAVVLFRV